MIPIIKEAFEKRFIRHPFQPQFSIVIRNAESTREDASDIQEQIEEIVLRLRIYKRGGVGFSCIIIDQHGWYDNPPIAAISNIEYVLHATFFYNVWERPGMPSAYVLERSDIEPLRSLFQLTNGMQLLKKSSFRFFFRGYHEPYATDRFLSNAIGLENLLVNDTNNRSNYRYKFADRGCFLLQRADNNSKEAEVIFKELQEIYDARSQIVHSNECSEFDWHEQSDIIKLQNSETYLRSLLLYVLQNPDMEKSSVVDKAKRILYK